MFFLERQFTNILRKVVSELTANEEHSVLLASGTTRLSAINDEFIH